MRKFINKKGFTLIELIVVMAVLAILVLLAAPRFLGYTKDAQVSAMQADVKVLSNSALQYNVKTNAWPVSATAVEEDDITALTGVDEEITAGIVANLDEALFNGFVKNIKGDYEDYVIVVEPGHKLEGEVFHKTGVVDAKDITHFGAAVNDEVVTP